VTYSARCACGRLYTFTGRSADDRPKCPDCGKVHKQNAHLDARIVKLNRNLETPAMAGMETKR
jgi:hypothetical protein